MSRLSKHVSSVNSPHKMRTSITTRQPCFTLKRPLIFQVRKSLVEYVDEELLHMNTSVFYQRIFILAKNVDPISESLPANAAPGANKIGGTGASEGEMTTLKTGEVISGEGEQHYSQPSTPETGPSKAELSAYEDAMDRPTVKITEPFDPQQETVTRTFNFGWDDDARDEPEAEAEQEPEPEVVEGPKDTFTLFTEMLQELQKKCRQLSYTPDPMCGLLVYMNEYTMLMLESGEDMMGIFCSELLACSDEYWQSNRVFMIEDHITDLYTKELIFRRIPAAFLNEKFPPSTPTDEYLMGKQHLIIKEKMHTICSLIKESLEPHLAVESSTVVVEPSSDPELANESLTDDQSNRVSFPSKRSTLMGSSALAPDIYRRLLPEIQRIELVLASNRFYYTLSEFVDLYGKVPFGRDDDSFYWPIQNNYAPPGIFNRTPFDINLTFSEYAAEMNRRMQEEHQKHNEELEAAAAAEKAAEQAQQEGQPRPRASQPNEQADN